MSNKRILSISPGQEELWGMAQKQGYVWIKSKNGFVIRDEFNSYSRIKTEIYEVWLSPETYGREWALTEGELNGKE